MAPHNYSNEETLVESTIAWYDPDNVKHINGIFTKFSIRKMDSSQNSKNKHEVFPVILQNPSLFFKVYQAIFEMNVNTLRNHNLKLWG